MSAMDGTCDFVREYAPPEQGPETELYHHLKTCDDCQADSVLVNRP